MKSLKIKLTYLLPMAAIYLLLLALLIPSEIHSQSQLTKITYNGMDAQTASGIVIALPKQSAQKIPLQVGYQIPPGTIVATPAATQLEFASVNGNVVTLQPNSKLRLTAGPNGENYTNYNGTTGFNVTRKMNFFNVTDSRGKVILASKSTAYIMSVSKNVVNYRTSQGEINVFKKVPLRIDEGSKDTNRNNKQSLSTFRVSSQSDQDFDGESVNVEQMEVKDFTTYEEAINSCLQLIQFFEQSGSFPLQLADEKSYLANLYLDDGRPDEAIAPLEEALDIYEQIDEYDPYVAEMTLDLAEA